METETQTEKAEDSPELKALALFKDYAVSSEYGRLHHDSMKNSWAIHDTVTIEEGRVVVNMQVSDVTHISPTSKHVMKYIPKRKAELTQYFAELEQKLGLSDTHMEVRGPKGDMCHRVIFSFPVEQLIGNKPLAAFQMHEASKWLGFTCEEIKGYFGGNPTLEQTRALLATMAQNLGHSPRVLLRGAQDIAK